MHAPLAAVRPVRVLSACAKTQAGEVASATAGAEHRLQDTIRDMEEVLMNEKDVESRFGYYSVGEGEEVRRQGFAFSRG